MKFKLGEFVRFVEERREGYITRIIDDVTIAVTDEEGFEIPVLASQVTRVHGHTIIDEEDDILENAPANLTSTGIFLAVSGDKKISAVVHFHLLNTTSNQLLASLTTEKHGRFRGEYAGIIMPGASVRVFSASVNELDQWPKFHFQVLLYSTENSELTKPLLYSEKFRAKDFSGTKKHSEFLDQPAWLFQMDDDGIPIDVRKLKESFYNQAGETREISGPEKITDLHIEKLRDDHEFLNKNEILEIQLAHFRKSLDSAIVHKLPSVIFIHGVGNGILRNEIHKAISRHPQVKTFMDAYKEKFGYGATEVILK